MLGGEAIACGCRRAAGSNGTTPSTGKCRAGIRKRRLPKEQSGRRQHPGELGMLPALQGTGRAGAALEPPGRKVSEVTQRLRSLEGRRALRGHARLRIPTVHTHARAHIHPHPVWARTHTRLRPCVQTPLYPCVHPGVHPPLHPGMSPHMHTHLRFLCVPRTHAFIPPCVHILALVHLCMHASPFSPCASPPKITLTVLGALPPQGWRRTATTTAPPARLLPAGCCHAAA